MAKRKREMTPAIIEKRIKEGRGSGRGNAYSPWLTIQDVPSNGRASRIDGWKSARAHHVMSDLERDYLYILDWSDQVTDIREQFPLLPIEETQDIAEELGFPHPTDPKTKEPIVMTSDFLVNLGNVEMAIAIKPASDLEDKRTVEKLEIERRYWQKRNVDWGLVTDLDLPDTIIRNIEWFYKEYHNADVDELGSFVVMNIEKIVYENLAKQSMLLAKATSHCDKKLGLEAGTSLSMIKHFLARKYWTVDMNERINPGRKLTRMTINHSLQSEIKLGG